MSVPPDDGAGTAGRTVRFRGLKPPWQPGQSGNPRGGAVSLLGLAGKIRRASGEGQELLDFYFVVFHGEPIFVPGRRHPIVPTLDHRMHAASWLVDRGWGRAPQFVEEEAQETPREERLRLLRRLSDEDRATLMAILNRMYQPDASGDDGSPAA